MSAAFARRALWQNTTSLAVKNSTPVKSGMFVVYVRKNFLETHARYIIKCGNWEPTPCLQHLSKSLLLKGQVIRNNWTLAKGALFPVSVRKALLVNYRLLNTSMSTSKKTCLYCVEKALPRNQLFCVGIWVRQALLIKKDVGKHVLQTPSVYRNCQNISDLVHERVDIGGKLPAAPGWKGLWMKTWFDRKNLALVESRGCGTKKSVSQSTMFLHMNCRGLMM